MNERIRALAAIAGFVLWADEEWKPEGETVDWSSNYDKELETLIKLIVWECTVVVQDAVDQREPASTYVGKIKEHFGVDL